MSRRMRTSSDLTKLMATPLRPNRPDRPMLIGRFNPFGDPFGDPSGDPFGDPFMIDDGRANKEDIENKP